MASHRIRRYALFFCVFILIPPLLWVGVVLIAPTAWGKRQLVAALEASSGRSVRLEGLSVRLLGGIQAEKPGDRLAAEHR